MLQNDKRLTYDTLIEPWAKHFGRNHVRIAVYEEISGNLFASMAAVFDLKLGPEEIDILGVSSKPVHVSPSKGTLILNRLAARTAKRLGVSRMDYMTKIAPQIRMIGERLSLTGSSRDLLSPVQRANIIKHYRPSNERFSKIWRSLPDVYFGN
jgi:hypothetical protein